MRELYAIWQSISDWQAKAIIQMDFSADTSYRFYLSPEMTTFQTRPLVARSATISIPFPYTSFTLQVDTETYTFSNGKSIINIADLPSYASVTVTLVSQTPGVVTVTLYDYQNNALDSQGLSDAQNQAQINAISASVIQLMYLRSSISSALHVIVTPGSNLNGVRVDGVLLGSAAGSRQDLMAKQTPPVGVEDPTSLVIAGTFNLSASYVQIYSLPLTLPPGYGLYEQSNDGAAGSSCRVLYAIL